MDREVEKSEKNDISQPEVLTRDDLITIIKQRCSAIGDLDGFDKTSLLDMFYKNVAPQPQRKHRFNRRGREMTKQQISHEKLKRRYNAISSDSSKDTDFQTVSGSGSVDRLRPPPAVNADRKIIKLGRKPNSNASGVMASTTNTSDPLTVSTNTKIKVTNTSKIKVSGQKKGNPNFAAPVRQQNGGGDSKMDICSSSEPETVPMVPKPKIVKIMPEKQQAPATKIKLKRPSAASIYVTHTESVDSVNTVVTPDSSDDCHSIIAPCSHVTSRKCDNHEQMVHSPEGKQAVMIDRTQMEGQDSNLTSEAKPTSQTSASQQIQVSASSRQPESSTVESTSPTEEGMMRKKFKRTAVQWP